MQSAILRRVLELTEPTDYFAVAGVEFSDGRYIVRCVALQTVDLRQVLFPVRKEFGVPVDVFFIQNSYSFRKQLIAKIHSERAL